jgi:hypothetical protein
MAASRFSFSDDNAGAVADIGRRLDGLPLAIELAAARIAQLPPAALLARLDKRLALLVDGPRVLPSRHQALRATIDWSYALLGEPGRAVFRRLAAFAGGASLEAVEAVCGGTDVPSVVDSLRRLMEASLVWEDSMPDGEPRLRMHETIGGYAEEQLMAEGEADATRRRHAAYFVELAESAEPELWGRGAPDWLPRVNREYDNLRLALRRLLEWNEIESAERLAAAAERAWQSGGRVADGRAWIAEVLGRPGGGARPRIRARFLTAAGALAVTYGDLAAARPLLEEGLSVWRELDDTRGAAWAMTNLGYLDVVRGDRASATRLIDEGLATAVSPSARSVCSSRYKGSPTWPRCAATLSERSNSPVPRPPSLKRVVAASGSRLLRPTTAWRATA